MEITGRQEIIALDDPADVGAVRRRASTLASDCGFDEARVSDVAIVVTEAAGNICKHAKHGTILLGVLEVDGQCGVSLAALDRGPGMDVERCRVDGMSTAGTPGLGLGAISRLSSHFDVYSWPDKGTVLTAVLWPRGAKQAAAAAAVGGVCVPYPGESTSGDGWAVAKGDDATSVIVVDGLGHGPAAAEASKPVLEVFRERPLDAPRSLLERAHGAARPTRGAAASIARIDWKARTVTFAGTGNVLGWLFDPNADSLRPMLSQHGTLGHALGRPREEVYPLPSGGYVILCSDGLKSRITLEPYRGIGQQTPSTIAALLWRDYQRGRDDATVVVVGPQPEQPPG